MGKEEERTQGPNREAAQRPHAVYQPWKWSSPTGCFLLFSFCVNKTPVLTSPSPVFTFVAPQCSSLCLCEEPRLLGSHPEALTLAVSLDYTDKLQPVMVTACSSALAPGSGRSSRVLTENLRCLRSHTRQIFNAYQIMIRRDRCRHLSPTPSQLRNKG